MHTFSIRGRGLAVPRFRRIGETNCDIGTAPAIYQVQHGQEHGQDVGGRHEGQDQHPGGRLRQRTSIGGMGIRLVKPPL